MLAVLSGLTSAAGIEVSAPDNAKDTATTEEKVPTTSAVSAILVDVDSGRVLYAKNAGQERHIASITKLMTALVAVESTQNLDREVTIQKEWTLTEGSSIYLTPGETISFRTLLYGMLLNSGNDAALAVAGICGGTVDTFVDWMNQRARDLGMFHTHFANPNGLNDEDHYSTASDMARLAAVCLKNETIAQIVSTKSITLEGRTFVNHNKLLWQYEGCTGMKTGYTELAGRTLISSAVREGQALVVVTLGDPDDWKDHKSLLDYGFSNYPKRVFYEEGQLVGKIPVEGSLIPLVSVRVKDQISYPIAQNENPEVSISLPKQVSAPVTEGEIAGKVTVTLKGKVVGESYLVYSDTVNRDSVKAVGGIQRFLEFCRSRETSGILQSFAYLRFGS